jgi:hypothetical protein
MSVPTTARLIAALIISLTGISNAVRVEAHHAFAAEFDGTKPVRLRGTLTKIEWTNPHSFFYLEVKSTDGKVTTWACESSNPSALSRRGMKKGDIKYGDLLIVDGYLARSGAPLIDARRIRLPDGRTIFGGSEGDGGPETATKSPTQPAPGAKQ